MHVQAGKTIVPERQRWLKVVKKISLWIELGKSYLYGRSITTELLPWGQVLLIKRSLDYTSDLICDNNSFKNVDKTNISPTFDQNQQKYEQMKDI